MSASGFSERRSSARLDMEGQVVLISWSDKQNLTQTKRVTCLDVSNGGLKIQLDSPLDIGTSMEVQLTEDRVSNRTFSAKVIRCIQLDSDRYYIGLQFS